MVDKFEIGVRRRGCNIVRTFRNRLPSIQSRCSEQIASDDAKSKNREPSLDHPYMLATAYLKTTSRD